MKKSRKESKFKNFYALKIRISQNGDKKKVSFVNSIDYFIVIFNEAKVELKLYHSFSFQQIKILYNKEIDRINEKGINYAKI